MSSMPPPFKNIAPAEIAISAAKRSKILIQKIEPISIRLSALHTFITALEDDLGEDNGSTSLAVIGAMRARSQKSNNSTQALQQTLAQAKVQKADDSALKKAAKLAFNDFRECITKLSKEAKNQGLTDKYNQAIQIRNDLEKLASKSFPKKAVTKTIASPQTGNQFKSVATETGKKEKQQPAQGSLNMPTEELSPAQALYNRIHGVTPKGTEPTTEKINTDNTENITEEVPKSFIERIADYGKEARDNEERIPPAKPQGSQRPSKKRAKQKAAERGKAYIPKKDTSFKL